jgi:RHS repeat-associated protein
MVTTYHAIDGEIVGYTTPLGRIDILVDGIGSIAAASSSDGHEPFEEQAPFGSTLGGVAPAKGRQFSWLGTWGYMRTFNPSASCYVRHRHYSTSIARWLSVDPLWPRLPAYVYVNNTPQTLVDPSGLWAAIVDEPTALELSYSHSFIQFEHPCMGAKSFGFGAWNSRNQEAEKRVADPKLGNVVCSPPRPDECVVENDLGGQIVRHIGKTPSGAVLFPDPASRNRRWNDKNRYNISKFTYDKGFEEALCDCIKKSLSKYAPEYRFYGAKDTEMGFYVCGTWTHDMWDCARRKVRLPRGETDDGPGFTWDMYDKVPPPGWVGQPTYIKPPGWRRRHGG